MKLYAAFARLLWLLISAAVRVFRPLACIAWHADVALRQVPRLRTRRMSAEDRRQFKEILALLERYRHDGQVITIRRRDGR